MASDGVKQKVPVPLLKEGAAATASSAVPAESALDAASPAPWSRAPAFALGAFESAVFADQSLFVERLFDDQF